MNPHLPWLWAAGVVQLLIASSNFFAPKKLHYAENLAKVSPIVREIFVMQCVTIVLVLTAFAALSFAFAADLAGQSALGRSISVFLAGFWWLRVGMQLFYYDREIKRQNPAWNLLFLTAFLYLAGVFSAAALGWLT
jgi:uncharacterized membrane protein YciS (DUF1049 family)